MSNQDMTYQDLLQIVELIKSSAQFSEFHLKSGLIDVSVKRANGAPQQVPPPADFATSRAAPVGLTGTPEVPPARQATLQPETTHAAQRHGHVGGGEVVVESESVVRQVTTQRPTTLALPEGSVTVKSPMVGTFYRAPEPGARPFVEVGERVEADSTVCVIEVMKLINSIHAGSAGVVTHILVKDGDPVEFGQQLIVIEAR